MKKFKPTKGKVITSMVFFTLAAGFVLTAVLLLTLTNANAISTVKSAVILEEPVIYPENEGKAVILKGKITVREPVTEPIFGFTFQSPVVTCESEQYTYTQGTYYNQGN